MSDSNSSSTQTTKQTDNRRVIGQGGVSNEGGSVSMSSVTNTTTLDANVVNSALKSVDKATSSGASVTMNAITSSLGFGKAAMTAAANAQKDALDFAASTSKANNAMAYNALTDALSAGSGAYTNALSFADKQSARAFDSLNSTETLVANAYADAKGRGALTDKILIGSIVAMAVVAFAAIQK
jgi:hypothetical protein